MSDDKPPPGDKPETSWTSGLQPPGAQSRPADDGEDGGFLRRWSRRKGAQGKTAKKSAEPVSRDPQTDVVEPSGNLEVELSPEAPVRGRMITSPPGGAPTANDEKNAAQEETDVEEAELPDVEEMGAESDFTPFLKKGVSEQLQRKALRKLWLSDPVLANVDGLLDYGDDFTDAAMIIENMKTVYTVGRGMVPEPKDPDAEAATDDEETLEEELTADGADSQEGEIDGAEEVSEGEGPDEAASGETRKIAQGHEVSEAPAAQRQSDEVPPDPDPAKKT